MKLDVALLVLRVQLALMLWGFHVTHKLAGLSRELHEFPDPLGIGHAPSFFLALGAEGICSLFVAVGFRTRLFSIPIVITMAMVLVLAARGFEGADVQSALLYALPYGVLAVTGGGRFSIDQRRHQRRSRAAASYVR